MRAFSTGSTSRGRIWIIHGEKNTYMYHDGEYTMDRRVGERYTSVKIMTPHYASCRAAIDAAVAEAERQGHSIGELK